MPFGVIWSAWGRDSRCVSKVDRLEYKTNYCILSLRVPCVTCSFPMGRTLCYAHCITPSFILYIYINLFTRYIQILQNPDRTSLKLSVGNVVESKFETVALLNVKSTAKKVFSSLRLFICKSISRGSDLAIGAVKGKYM